MNQQEIILNYLQRKGSINIFQSIKKYMITRLSAVILELKKKGNIIKSVNRTMYKKIKGKKIAINYVDYVLE